LGSVFSDLHEVRSLRPIEQRNQVWHCFPSLELKHADDCLQAAAGVG
jgi:hypothetical protein